MTINNSMAPAQVYSFVSQSIYFATHLIKYSSFDCSLSVEEIGDVGVDGELNEIVELKNAQHASHNPLSNSSIDLWKTLYNWVMFFYKNKDFIIDEFRLLLYINSKNECRADIAKDINECNSKENYNDIIKKIKKDILKNEKYKRRMLDSIIKTEVSATSKFYIECLLSSELHEYFEKVCFKFAYEISNIDYYVQLENLLKINYGCQDVAIINSIAQQLIGWVDKKITQSIAMKQPATIHTKEFQDFTQQYIGIYMMPNKYMKHINIIPSENELIDELKSSPRYLKQLDLIGVSALKSQAVSYFLQLKLERKNWIKSGLLESVSDSKYVAYQNSLYRTWEMYSLQNSLKLSDKKEIGQETLFNMLQYNANKFDNETIDIDITRGFVHELADYESDIDIAIGWHPDFKELLNNEKK